MPGLEPQVRTLQWLLKSPCQVQEAPLASGSQDFSSVSLAAETGGGVHTGLYFLARVWYSVEPGQWGFPRGCPNHKTE